MEPIILVSGNYSAYADGYPSYPGVYMVSGLMPSNTFAQPIYIGSSEDMKRRVSQHLVGLLNGNHFNKVLQNAYIKHGPENFVVWELEKCRKEETVSLEQEYLDYYRPFADERGGFNLAKYADAPNKGRKTSEETRRKMSESHKGLKKGTKQTKEHVDKLSSARSKEWIFVNPKGEVVRFKNLNRFCRENNLASSNMCSLFHGKKEMVKGWTKYNGENN